MEATMAKLEKLYEDLLATATPRIAFRDFERLLAVFGFFEKRRRGSHRAYKHPRVPELLTVQPRGKEAQPYQVRKLLDMIVQFGLEMDR
jgi:predicted RNA binding protein YcfA (HicA-like mRNA interferase family)